MTQTVLLGDVADINVESVGKNYVHDKILYLDTSSVTENTFSGLQSFALSDAPSRAKRIIRDGDIVYSTVRPNLKHFGYIKNPTANTVASTGFAVIRAKEEIDSKYLYYWLTSDERTEYLTAIADSQTSTFPAFNPAILAKLKIEIPEIKKQKKIADILGSLDDKIELNRKMNETLEQMGQALFRHYFIDNPEAEKWEEKPISNQVEILSGGTPKTSESSYWGGDIPWFSVLDAPSGSNLFTINTTKNITDEGLKNSAAKIIPKYTTIISARGTVGKLALAGRAMTINQSCYALRSEMPFYTYLMIDHSLGEIKSRVHGSVFDTITRNTFDQLKFKVPPTTHLKQFEEEIEPLFRQMLSNVEQIQTLTTLRDTLLPRLISGKVKV